MQITTSHFVKKTRAGESGKIKPLWDTKGKYAMMISNDEINDILCQYNGVNNFVFMPIIEFASLKNMDNIDKYAHTECKLGFVIYLKIANYAHWISVWVDIPERIIRYFDSNADSNDRYYVLDIIKIMRKKLFDKRDVLLEYNNKYIQTDSYSCGLYVIDFIVMNIETPESKNKYDKWVKSFISFKSKVGRKFYEEAILKMRDKYFKKKK